MKNDRPKENEKGKYKDSLNFVGEVIAGERGNSRSFDLVHVVGALITGNDVLHRSTCFRFRFII